MFLCVFLAGCTSEESENKQNDPLPSGSEIESIISRIPAEYKKSSVFASCSQLAVENCLQQDVLERVQQKGQVEACSVLFSPESQVSCKNSFYNQKSREALDPQMCEKMDGDSVQQFCKQGIIISLAVEKKNIALCDPLKNDFKRDCVISVANQLAMKTKDKKWCDSLSDAKQKENCLRLLK